MLLVLVVKPHCPACKRFMARLMHDPALIRRISQKYISVIVTDDAYRNYPNELYYTLEYPTLFLVDPSDEHFITDPLTDVSIRALKNSFNPQPSRRREK